MKVGEMQQLEGNFILQIGNFCQSELKSSPKVDNKTRRPVWTRDCHGSAKTGYYTWPLIPIIHGSDPQIYMDICDPYTIFG